VCGGGFQVAAVAKFDYMGQELNRDRMGTMKIKCKASVLIGFNLL